MPPDDIEWITPQEAERRYLVLADTVREWAKRGVVRSLRGKRVAVAAIDVARAEKEWRQHGRYTGTRPRGQVAHGR